MKKYLLLFGLGVLSLFWFDYKIITELFHDGQFRMSGDDALIAQYHAELFRQRILSGKYPFSKDNLLLYPFGTEVAALDLGLAHVWPFLLFRPFLSMHASFQLMILTNTFLSYLLMYHCLKKIKVSTEICVIGAIAYAFMPFMGYGRITEHYTYMHHYLFPGLFLAGWNWYKSKNKSNWRWLVLLGGIWGYSIWVNFYYFVMVSMCLSMMWWMKRFKISWKAMLVTSLMAIVTGLPVLAGMKYSWSTIGNMKRTIPASTYSSKLVSFFVPSPASIYFNNRMNVNQARLWGPGEGTSYCGLFLIMGVGLCVWQWKKSKREEVKWALIFLGCFLWLSLGPEVQMVSWWESEPTVIKTKIPSLYAMISLVSPVFNQLRAPCRFVVPAVFIGILLSSHAWSGLINNPQAVRYRKWWLILLMAIVLIDQRYYVEEKVYHSFNLPLKAYQKIAVDDNKTSVVMELPMTIRDGYRLLAGTSRNLVYMFGPLYHKHPILGGYVSRIDDKIFDFYFSQEIPALAILASTDKTKTEVPPLIASIPIQDWENKFKDLNIGYVLLPRSLPVYEELTTLLTAIGFQIGLVDGEYVLYEKY